MLARSRRARSDHLRIKISSLFTTTHHWIAAQGGRREHQDQGRNNSSSSRRATLQISPLMPRPSPRRVLQHFHYPKGRAASSTPTFTRALFVGLIRLFTVKSSRQYTDTEANGDSAVRAFYTHRPIRHNPASDQPRHVYCMQSRLRRKSTKSSPELSLKIWQ
jgi:hypothetical protein